VHTPTSTKSPPSNAQNHQDRYVEIRPGEGGIDAVDFAKLLTDAVCAYARRHAISAFVTQGRTTVITLNGARYDCQALENLCGTHRIQRIPRSDTSGRRHTATATFALLDAQPTNGVELNDNDLRVDVYRGPGKGGQHRNKTDSAVRLTHLPTGQRVVVQRGRSQRENLATARTELIRRLNATTNTAAADKHNHNRRNQIASPDMPAKQWTWNTQRGEVLDHTTNRRYPIKDFERGRFELAL
jgi:peptide chain release factor 1